MLESSAVRERLIEEDSTDQLRAAVYARTSSKSQRQGYSLDAQVDRCIDRCRSLGWKIVFLFRDSAESGKDTDRPMFQKMIGAAKKKMFDVIVFWKLDRFSRSLIHAVQLDSDLRKHDIYLYSVTEQIDTTSATGRFNFRNLASAAEFERDMIRQRSQMGLKQLAAEQKWPNGSAPLGYELDADNRLSVVESEQNLVIEIFQMYVEERSMPEVARNLNERGITSQDGGEWTPRAIGDILRNEIYVGQYEVGDVSDHVTEYQIIEEDLFEQVTSIRNRFQSDNSSKPSMSDPRKEEAISRIRDRYGKYLTAQASKPNQ